MGSVSSKENDWASLGLLLPRQIYETEDMMNGFILLDVKKEIRINHLWLFFHGFQYIHYSKKGESGEVLETSRSIITQKIEIEDLRDDTLKRNKYKIPFQFKIPENIPSSFTYEQQSEWAEIHYQLYVEMSITKTKHQLEFSRSVEIYRPILNLLRPKQRKDEKRIENCARCSRGKTILSGSLEYNNYHALSSIVGQIQVDN